ncbi:MAG TPA: DNA-deoxyinosine glycosylase [Casimicrobiaceae bacterium]|jgi:hypoxanthine-DNA glycosylase|nr:DNA-deoxyinosine glycosylase [Casimicrobiaceae bacterium]
MPRATAARAPAARAPRGAALEGLAPVIARDTRVLILGSFPSVASLAAAQYYAHPRNHFWPMLSAVLDEPLTTLAYRARLARVRAHRVGIWDTIVACEREGSLDADIRNALHGEIVRVTTVARNLRAVCFNGGTAARAEPAWREAGFATLRMPSTSPAYTRPLAEKIAAWRALTAFL